MELEGRETSERKVPETLEEAYELRDASATPEERGFYQEHVYRLRAEKYRSRGIRIEESLRRRERSRAEALQQLVGRPKTIPGKEAGSRAAIGSRSAPSIVTRGNRV